MHATSLQILECVWSEDEDQQTAALDVAIEIQQATHELVHASEDVVPALSLRDLRAAPVFEIGLTPPTDRVRFFRDYLPKLHAFMVSATGSSNLRFAH